MDYQNNNYNNCTLFMYCGLPRSGKSSQARELSKKNGWPLVGVDEIRLSVHGLPFVQSAENIVWTIARHMVEALFLAGHETVILDCCNHTKFRRNQWVSKNWKSVYHYIDTSKEICIQRAVDTDQAYLIPVIERMARELEIPSGDA